MFDCVKKSEIKLRFTLTLLSVCLCFAADITAGQAQQFLPSASKNPANSAKTLQLAPSQKQRPVPTRSPQTTTTPAATTAQAQSQQPASEEVTEQKTEKKSSAYTIRFVGDDITVEEEPIIFLYMKDFEISSTIRGGPSCTMSFYIRPITKENVSSISYQLKWKDMQAALTFDNVEANVPTYHRYTLLGEGCYNMDKTPNIIVNRCRIKGMSQKRCADAIRWRK